MTFQMENITDLRGHEVVDRDGDKIGKLEEIYLDQETGKPEWALVKTGLFGSASTFVPLAGAERADEGLRVPYEKSHVKDAPSMEADGELSSDEEARLYRHYGLDYGDSSADSGATGGPGNDTSGPNTDDAMTRSEEELQVGKTTRERGRARLKKYVVTEQVTQTVPVQREEVRIEREPITDANADAATDGPAISEEEHEVTLHEEQVVTSKQAVPKERVRLDKDTVTDEQQVSEEVRKERIEADGDVR
ncbi:MAG: hypothetical protein QOH76_678 [Thermoleophilaceae bacterium]|nr:hypothetical protein [Thermoleophilaceae bacterium]